VIYAAHGVEYEIPDEFDCTKNSSVNRSAFEWQKAQQEADKAAGKHPFGRSFTNADLKRVMSSGRVIGIDQNLEKNLKKAKVTDVFASSPR